MRSSTSARISSGSCSSSCAALSDCRCARISAIVCGCSPRMNFESCSGLARSSDANPAVDVQRRDDRDRECGASDRGRASSAAAAAPDRRRRSRTATPLADCVELGQDLLAELRRRPRRSSAISRATRSISSSLQVLEDRRRALFAEHHQRDGGLARAADGVARTGHQRCSFSHPAAHDAGELFGLFAGELRDALRQHRQALGLARRRRRAPLRSAPSIS